MIIWLQSSPLCHYPSGHQKRRSSCAGYLSGTAPVLTHTTKICISISVVWLLMAFQSKALAAVVLVVDVWGTAKDHVWVTACFIMQGDGETAWLLSTTTMWVQRLAQPELYPPHSHAPLGFSNWLQQIIEYMMRSTLIRHVHLYITSLIWLSTLPAFCVNTKCIRI